MSSQKFPVLTRQTCEFRIRIVIDENLSEVGALFGHSFRSGLTQADAVALTNAFEYNLTAVPFDSEIVARNSIPTQSAIYLQA
jgi:hypothetical protein